MTIHHRLAFLALSWVLTGHIGSANAESSPQLQRTTLGRSIAGQPIECEVYGSGPDVLLVIATIHGNESAGTPLVQAFGQWLLEHPAEMQGHTVVIVPVANPDGMASAARHNLRGVDLNRNFPAGNWDNSEVKLHGPTPLSEPESRALMAAICQYFPDRIVSIHQPLACVDYDGAAEGLAQAIARHCPLPVKKLGGLPGSLGSFVGETLQKPIITLELPKEVDRDPQVLWKTYGGALRAALHHAAPKPAK